MQVFEAGDFGLHHQRFLLAVESEISTGTRAVEVGFAHPFDLHFADELAHPLASPGLLGLEPDIGGWLRQHDLGKMAVDVFELGLALETQDQWVPAFSVLSYRRMKLGEPLQAGQFVQDKPHSFLLRLGLI